MHKTTFSATVRALCVAAFVLALPLALSAEEFGTPFPLIRSMNLQSSIQVDGKPVKSPVTVAADADFTIIWKSTGLGCVSNW